MKLILAMMILASTLSAGCTTVVMTDVVEPRPVIIAENYRDVRPIVNYMPAPIITPVIAPVVTPVIVPNCYSVTTPVYGYTDVYRDAYTHVRIEEVSYINQQWRCN